MSTKVFRSEEGRRLVLDAYKKILANWPVSSKQYTVPTRFGETFVIESGDGGKPPLLLLHGSVSNSVLWAADVRIFSEAYHVFAIDIIGEAGLSSESRPPYQGGAYAEWILDVVNALGLPGVSMVGLSLGGWITTEFATTYPEKVHKMVLICPGGLAKERKSFLWKSLLYKMGGKWGKQRMLALIMGSSASMPTSQNGPLGQGIAFTMTIGKNFKPRMGSLPLFSDDRLKRLRCPVLIVFGDSDYLLDAQASMQRMKANVATCEAVLLPNTGHVIIQQGERIAAFLMKEAPTRA